MAGVIQAIRHNEYFLSQDLSLLVVDDDRSTRDCCKSIAESLGFAVFTAETIAAALRLLAARSMDVILMDFSLPDPDGVEALARIKKVHTGSEVVVLGGNTNVDSVLSAMKGGAYDYLRKPLHKEELKGLLERVTVRLRNSQVEGNGRGRPRSESVSGGLIGQSLEMQKLYRIVAKIASSKHPVLILGENGTGKEKLARAIHAGGIYQNRPFVPVDCASPSPALLEGGLFGYAKGAFAGATKAKEGLLSLVNGGTVFLDEVGELPLDLQGKLLRVLQEKEIHPVGSTRATPIDLRAIAATSRDLEAAVQQGTFRRDLFFRLNVVSLRVPPLRERKEDIRLLAEHILQQISPGKGLSHSVSPEAMKHLLSYDWPGNVRELENCLERAAAVSTVPLLTPSELPPHIRAADPLTMAKGLSSAEKIVPLAEIEKQAIISTLKQLNGDKLTAARLLGIGKTTLYRKLREYGMGEQWISRQAAK